MKGRHRISNKITSYPVEIQVPDELTLCRHVSRLRDCEHSIIHWVYGRDIDNSHLYSRHVNCSFVKILSSCPKCARKSSVNWIMEVYKTKPAMVWYRDYNIGAVRDLDKGEVSKYIFFIEEDVVV